MSEMVIFNCPAYKGFTRDTPDWLDNTNCGHYAGQVPCQDCTDCIMKQIVDKCKDKMGTEFNSGSMFAEEILQLFEIEECE